MDIALYTKDEVKCKLIAYERCSKTTITFSKDKYREERYNEYINEFKSNKNIHKLVKIEEGIEEILFEREWWYEYRNYRINNED